MHVTKKAQKPSEYVYARLSELVTKIGQKPSEFVTFPTLLRLFTPQYKCSIPSHHYECVMFWSWYRSCYHNLHIVKMKLDYKTPDLMMQQSQSSVTQPGHSFNPYTL